MFSRPCFIATWGAVAGCLAKLDAPSHADQAESFCTCSDRAIVSASSSIYMETNASQGKVRGRLTVSHQASWAHTDQQELLPIRGTGLVTAVVHPKKASRERA